MTITSTQSSHFVQNTLCIYLNNLLLHILADPFHLGQAETLSIL